MAPWLAALMAAAASLALQPTSAPTGEGLVDRFLTVFPQEERARLAGQDFPAMEMGPLVELNPARAGEIRGLFETHAACATPVISRMIDNGLRHVARQLGDENLARIIQYYESGDARFIAELSDRTRLGERPSPADQVRGERIIATYPLAEYALEIEATVDREEPLASDLFRCDGELDTGLQQLGLRYPGDGAP